MAHINWPKIQQVKHTQEANNQKLELIFWASFYVSHTRKERIFPKIPAGIMIAKYNWYIPSAARWVQSFNVKCKKMFIF